MKAPRALIALSLIAGMTAIVSGQDRGVDDKQKKDQAEQPKDAIVRVARDLQTAEERLRNSDPGDLTRKVQRDIIDGLDELIKQNTKSDSGQSQSSKMKQKASSKTDPSSQQDKQTGKKDQTGLDPDKGKDQDKKSGDKKGDEQKSGGGKDDSKDGKKDDKKDGGKADDPSKDPGKKGGSGDENKDSKDKKEKSDPTSELYRTDWGHLPLTKRLEMDAYSKERFMPRYDEVLQQYYRTIAEQGKGK